MTFMSTIRRIFDDERGTTLTEFVITLPVFLLIFVGIVELGRLTMPLPLAEAKAHKKTFDSALEVQQTTLNLAGAAHSVPTIAGGDAIAQTINYEPRQRGLYADAIKIAESKTYSFDGLALSGHFGESASRVDLIRMLGTTIAGVDAVVSYQAAPFVGTSDFARQIVDDGPNASFDGDMLESGLQPNIGTGIGIINGLLDLSGARAALAAGVRYGTVSEEETHRVENEHFSMDVRGWYTTTVPSYVSGNNWMDEMRSAGVARLTMANWYRYNEILGYNAYQDSTGGAYRRAVYDQPKIEVTGPKGLPIWYPLDYDATVHDD